MRTGRYLQSVRGALAEGAQTQLDLALSGDALAARRLMIAAPRRLRGHIASLAYHLKTRNPAYRELIKGVWACNSRHLLCAHLPQQMVRRMLARADFPRPELTGSVAIFRAVVNISVKRAAAGLNWSLSREFAAAEAAKADRLNARIVRATIDPADIIYWSGSRNGQEVVPRRSIENFAVESATPSRSPKSVTSSSAAGRLRSGAARGRDARRG